MKILYAIQGTGNGHLSRSMDIVPCLAKHGEVDVLVSGSQGDLTLPFPVKYKFYGLSFIFGKSGGVSLWKTARKTNFLKLLREINRLPVHNYDLIINDFAPVSAWACRLKKKPCISLSHQAAVLDPEVPKPEDSDRMGEWILKHYAPGSLKYGFHFRGNGQNIFTPVIRRQVREQEISDEGHYTVYLPSYDDDRLIKRLSAYAHVKWEVFSKHNKKEMVFENVRVQPIDNEKFTRSMATSTGVLCGAGFETPAEALFLGKKLLVMPMKNQYEQHLNAAALRAMNVPVIQSFKTRHAYQILEWLDNDNRVAVDYPDITRDVVDMIVNKHGTKS